MHSAAIAAAAAAALVEVIADRLDSQLYLPDIDNFTFLSPAFSILNSLAVIMSRIRAVYTLIKSNDVPMINIEYTLPLCSG